MRKGWRRAVQLHRPTKRKRGIEHSAPPDAFAPSTAKRSPGSGAIYRHCPASSWWARSTSWRCRFSF